MHFLVQAISVTVGTFCLGKYEVTQEQWVAVMGSNPSKFKGKTLPVEQVGRWVWRRTTKEVRP